MSTQAISNKVIVEPERLKGVPLPLVDKLSAACAAVRKSRTASREAYAAIYDFCLAALEKGSGLNKFCTNLGIKTRETQGGAPINTFILPVKLATGVLVTDEGVTSWVVNDDRVSKFASVFAYVSWSHFVGQFGSLGKVYSDSSSCCLNQV